jgi:hypothetical protein
MSTNINDVETPIQEEERVQKEEERIKKEESSQPSFNKQNSNNSSTSFELSDLVPKKPNQEIDWTKGVEYGVPAVTGLYLGGKAVQGLGKRIERKISGEDLGAKTNEKIANTNSKLADYQISGGIDPETALRMKIAQEAHEAEQRRADELNQAKINKMAVKPTQATANPVTPAQAGSSIELPNTNIGPVPTTPNANPMDVVNQAPGVAPAPAPAPGVTPAPAITPTNSAPNALPGAVNTQAVPGTMPAPQQSAQPAEVPNQPVNTPAQQLAENITSEPPTNPASTAQPTAQVEANPVESGEGVSTLHEPGKEAGATQIETTEKSTGNEKLKTEGAKEPPFNKEYTPKGMIKNPIKKTKEEEIGRGLFNWLQGQEGPNAEAVYRDLYGVGNKPYNEENVKKYHAWKQSVPPGMEMNDKLSMRGNYKRQEFVPESMKGSADLKTMATLLAGGGSAALIGYMMKNHPDFAEHYTKALESMGENFTTEGLVGHNKAEELSPAMRQIFLKSGNPVYRKELNEQLSTEKDPERIKELKHELEKAK